MAVDEDPEQLESNGLIHAEAHAAGGLDSKAKLPFAAKGWRNWERLCASRPRAVSWQLAPAEVTARRPIESMSADSGSTTVVTCFLLQLYVVLAATAIALQHGP